MTFGPGVLLERLDALETAGNRPCRYVIALSGGLDSTVLLHTLAVTRERHGKALLALHVDHRLQPDSRRIGISGIDGRFRECHFPFKLQHLFQRRDFFSRNFTLFYFINHNLGKVNYAVYWVVDFVGNACCQFTY